MGASPLAQDAQQHPPAESTRRAHSGFRHEVILHGDGADGFVRQTMPLLEDAIDGGAPVVVAVAPDRIELLREGLGARARRIVFADMRRLGSNPARIIPAWREFLARESPGGSEPLGIGEPVWADRTAPELDECMRHEALLNLVFGGGPPWRLLCPYDLDGLEDHVIEAAHLCHPLIGDAAGVYPSSCYRGQARPFDGTLEEPPVQCDELAFSEADLGAIRHRLGSWARIEGLDAEGTEDLILAVDEIATNSIRHGGGGGRLRMWRDGGTLLCEIRDGGEMRDPLLGRVLPGDGSACGRGMWIVNQLCDLVQVRSSHAGSQIRMHKRLAF